MNGSVHKRGSRQGLNVFCIKDLAFRTVKENAPWSLTPDRPPVLDHHVDGLRILD